MAVYILIHDLNLVNAPDLRTKLINCVVDIFWRGVAALLTCTHPDPYGRIERKRKTICHMILRSPNLLLSLLASYFYWLAGFVFR